MKYVTFLEIFLWSLLFCFVLALVIQAIWILTHKGTEKPTIVRLLSGLCITAGGSGLLVSFLITYLIPTVYVVDADDYESEWFVSSEWSSQLTKTYIDNQSGEDLCFVAVGYGTDKYVDEYIYIPEGAVVECNNSIAGYNTAPPREIYSKSSGEIKWYLYSISYAVDEIF